MKKVPTIFMRNPDRMQEVLPEQNPVCKWVFEGQGVATRKYDGSCCRVKDGRLWKRRELKKGSLTPDGFEQSDFDPVTGKTVGWVPVEDQNSDAWHIEAFGNGQFQDGTYELCGPKVQGNPERLTNHILVRHSTATRYKNVPRTFEGIRDFLDTLDIEGIVFHHPDGRMAKIKKRDFNKKRQ